MRIAELQGNLAKKTATGLAPCEDLYSVLRHPAWLLQAIQQVLRQYPLEARGHERRAFAETLIAPLGQALRAPGCAPASLCSGPLALRDRVICEALRMVWAPIFTGWAQGHSSEHLRFFSHPAEARKALQQTLHKQGAWWAIGIRGLCPKAPLWEALVRDKPLMALSRSFYHLAPMDFVREASSAMRMEAVLAAAGIEAPPGINWQGFVCGNALVLLTDGPKRFIEGWQARLQGALDPCEAPLVWQAHVEDGFEFLGCHFQQAQDGQKPLRVCLAKGQVQTFKAAVVALTAKSTIGEDPAEKIQALNSLIRRWVRMYPDNMGRTVSSHLGRFVHERLYRWLRAKHANVGARVSAEKFVASGYLRPRMGRQVWTASGVSLLSFNKTRVYAR